MLLECLEKKTHIPTEHEFQFIKNGGIQVIRTFKSVNSEDMFSVEATLTAYIVCAGKKYH